MPKPIEEAGGSGMHINFSFADKDGKNAFDTGAQGGQAHMNDLAKGCVSGLVHHHKGLAGLVAPTANSYGRLQPASLSGYWKNWGGRPSQCHHPCFGRRWRQVPAGTSHG